MWCKHFLNVCNSRFSLLTVACVFSHNNSNMPIFSPISSPRVSDGPITILRIISNSNHGMISSVLWTAGIFKNTPSVSLEIVIHIKTNCNWLLGYGIFKRFNAQINVLMAGNGGGFHRRIVHAISFITIIRVIVFRSDSVLILDDFVAPSQGTSTAASTTTVQKILFRKTYKRISSYHPCSLNNSDLSKSPTASTLSLIFYRAHDISPIC